MNTVPLTAEQYRNLAEANRAFASRCIDPDVASQYRQLAKVFDDIAKRLEPLSWAFLGAKTKTSVAA
jgi:hypothetical protein